MTSRAPPARVIQGENFVGILRLIALPGNRKTLDLKLKVAAIFMAVLLAKLTRKHAMRDGVGTIGNGRSFSLAFVLVNDCQPV